MRLIKIPSSLGGLGKSDGSELAPDIVVKETKELFLNEEGILPNFSIEEIEIVKNNLTETNNNIFNFAKKAFAENECPLFLGGDHSITVPIVRAFSQQYKNCGMIVFDAHPDCMDEFGTQEDVITGIVNNNFVKKENIVIIGLRNWDKKEIEFLKNNKIKFFQMDQITEEGIHEIADAVMEIARGWNAIYLSIDIDSVDPAFAPGTCCVEPGGLTSRELLYFLHRLKKLNKIKGIDVVEINPRKDINNITAKLGAKILVEMC